MLLFFCSHSSGKKKKIISVKGMWPVMNNVLAYILKDEEVHNTLFWSFSFKFFCIPCNSSLVWMHIDAKKTYDNHLVFLPLQKESWALQVFMLMRMYFFLMRTVKWIGREYIHKTYLVSSCIISVGCWFDLPDIGWGRFSVECVWAFFLLNSHHNILP